MKSKWLGLIVVFATLLLLAACGGNEKPTEEGSKEGSSKSDNKLVITSFGGEFEAAQMEHLIKPFEKEFDAKVEVITLYSADALARIKAQKDNPEIDIVQFSGGQEVQAAEEGLIEKINPEIVTNVSDIYEGALLDKEYGPATAFSALGLLYNTDKVNEVPTSWETLWEDEYKGKIALTDISNAYGMYFLIINALLNDGNEENIDPGFNEIVSLLPNTAAVVATSADLGNLFAQEEIMLAPYDSGYAFNYSKQGLPIGFSIPEEGTTASFVNMQIVSGTEQSDLANEFINFALRPEVQQAMVEQTGFSPTNKNVEISDELAEVIPYGEDAINNLIHIDWNPVNKNKDEWNERWSKLITQ